MLRPGSWRFLPSSAAGFCVVRVGVNASEVRCLHQSRTPVMGGGKQAASAGRFSGAVLGVWFRTRWNCILGCFSGYRGEPKSYSSDLCHTALSLLWSLFLQLTPCLCKMFAAISWEFCSLMLGTYFPEWVIIRDTC